MNLSSSGLKYSYTLGDPKEVCLRGRKLTNPNIVVRQIIFMPSTKGAKKYWLVVGVSDMKDINVVGEIMIDVKPSDNAEHETFVTVESGMRSGQQGSQRILIRTRLEKKHIEVIYDVRNRLLKDWVELLQDPSPANNKLILIAENLENARLKLRVDARERTESSVGFKDSISRPNPVANAARLTAAIARLRMQIEADLFSRYSLHYRFLNCTVIAENIASDIWDIEVMADKFSSRYSNEILKRLNRISIKPYFWAVLWIKKNIGDSPQKIFEFAPFIAQLLLTEQRLGEIDILLSEYKRADYENKKTLLRLITFSIANFPQAAMPLGYIELFNELRKKSHRLAISKSKSADRYIITANAMQKIIRYRASANPDDCWYIPTL